MSIRPLRPEAWQMQPKGQPLLDFCEAGRDCRRRMTCARYLYLPLRPVGHGRIHGHMCPDLSMNQADPKIHWKPVEEHSRDTLIELDRKVKRHKRSGVEPGNKLPSATVTEIIALKQEGISNAKVSKALGVGITSVKHYWSTFRAVTSSSK